MKLIEINGVRGYIDDNGTAQLNLEDVSRGLGFTQIANSGNEVVRWERVNKYLTEFKFVPTSGDGTFIPENIFYRMAMKARNETAEIFQAKVADEILPQIRKTGSYSVQPQMALPQTYVEALKALVSSEEQKQTLQLKIEADRSKVVFAESLEVSSNSILIGQLAKLLKQNGINIGQNRLFEILRKEGYLMRSGSDNVPTQRSMDLKIMEIKVGTRSSSTEGTKSTFTPKVTGKGQFYFINKFKSLQQAN